MSEGVSLSVFVFHSELLLLLFVMRIEFGGSGCSRLVQLSLDLVQDWIRQNGSAAILGGGENCGAMNITGIAPYQPLDGLMELKVVIQTFSSFFVFVQNYYSLPSVWFVLLLYWLNL